MPEGPEVKIIGEQLSSILSNKTLVELKILSGKYTGKCELLNYHQFSKSLPLKIKKIETKGKLIYFILEHGWYLFNTLGMSYHDLGSPSTAFIYLPSKMPSFNICSGV